MLLKRSNFEGTQAWPVPFGDPEGVGQRIFDHRMHVHLLSRADGGCEIVFFWLRNSLFWVAESFFLVAESSFFWLRNRLFFGCGSAFSWLRKRVWFWLRNRRNLVAEASKYGFGIGIYSPNWHPSISSTHTWTILTWSTCALPTLTSDDSMCGNLSLILRIGSRLVPSANVKDKDELRNYLLQQKRAMLMVTETRPKF